MKQQLVKYRAMFVGCMLALVAVPALALDPFSVYRAKAPTDCLDAKIGEEAIDLIQLIQIGICNNPTLSRSYMSVKESEASYGASRSSYLPDITALAGLNASHQREQGEHGRQEEPYEANVALSWLMYDFGGRSAQVDQMKAYLDAAQFTYNATLRDTVLSITTAYFDLLSAEEVLKSARTSEASFKKSYEESVRRFELGLVSASDQLLAKTTYEQSRLTVVQAENAVKQNAGVLAVLLNLPPDTPFTLAPPPKDRDITQLETDMTVSEMMEVALTARPEMQSKRSTLLAAEKAIDIARSEGLPSVSVTARAGYDDAWKHRTNYQLSSSIGVSLSIPIFMGFSNTYNVSAARFRYNQAALDLAATADDIRNQVWSAYQNYQTAISSYAITQKALESAVENERVAFASYQIGQESILNLLTAGSQLATARTDVIVAFYGVLTSKSTLYRAIGRF